MEYQFNEGGRFASGFRGQAGDCVTRAIAIATDTQYRQIYKALSGLTKVMTGGLETTARNGCSKPVAHQYLTGLGWSLVLTPKCYLIDAPKNQRIIAVLPRHKVAVINGTVHDSWDSRVSRRTKNGSPRLLGYYIKG